MGVGLRPEKLKDGVERLLGLGVLVDLDAEEVALVVPSHAQIGDGEKVLLAQLHSRG